MQYDYNSPSNLSSDNIALAPPIENFRLTQLMCWSFFIRIDASIKVHKIRAKLYVKLQCL